MGSPAGIFTKYFQVLDSVPGSPMSILLGFYIKDQCSSCRSTVWN